MGDAGEECAASPVWQACPPRGGRGFSMREEKPSRQLPESHLSETVSLRRSRFRDSRAGESDRAIVKRVASVEVATLYRLRHPRLALSGMHQERLRPY
jgi:hypothetical protein